MKPLEGIRVLDFSTIISGPMATSILCDQGADVIKIEQPGMGDLCRYLGPIKGGMSAMFATTNRGKKSITLDIGKDEGKQAVRALLADADILVQNFRPGVMDRLGLGYEALHQIAPHLIYVSISGFGDTGPFAGQRVYDPVIQVTSGIAASQADPADGKPQLIRSLVCDKLTAITAAQAMTAALFQRDRQASKGGKAEGIHLKLNMLDASVAFSWPDAMYNFVWQGEGWTPSPNLSDIYSIRETKDGAITVIAVSPVEFMGLMKALGLLDFAEANNLADMEARAGHMDEIAQRIGDALIVMTTDQALAALQAEDVPCAIVHSREDVLTDPQVVHNQTIVTVDDDGPAGPFFSPRPPAQFGDSVVDLASPPVLGADTDMVLEQAGFDDAARAALKTAGII